MTLRKGTCENIIENNKSWQPAFSSLLILSQTTNFRLLQLKEFPDYNFKVDENGRKFSKWIEKTVGKGEIACSEQFLLFPQCFQKTWTADTYKPGLVWERVKPLSQLVHKHFITLCHQNFLTSYELSHMLHDGSYSLPAF